MNEAEDGNVGRNDARFDYLMSRHLSRETSEQEESELRWLAEHGFEERFKMWIDAHYQTETTTGDMPDQTRRQILANILENKTEPQKSPLFRWSWAAAAIMALGTAFWFYSRNDQASQQLSIQKELIRNQEKLVFKGRQYLHLPDGSTVLMKEGSELAYSPELFQKGSRIVEMKGEAFFDIVHNPESAFLVTVGDVVTRVLGTAFNVRTQQHQVAVTVTRGLVEVGRNSAVYTKVKPNEQITVDTETSQYDVAKVDIAESLSWKNSYLILDNVSLEQAQKLIEDHYKIELNFAEPALLKCHVTALFLNEEDLPTVLKVLSEMTGATYAIDGKKAVIKGGSCI